MIMLAPLAVLAVMLYPAQADLIDVAFDVTVPAGATSAVFVAGNLPELGAWRAAGLELERGADGHWRGHIGLPPGSKLEYKITKGFWTTEETTAAGESIANRTLDVPTLDTPGSKPAVTATATVAGWRDVLRRPALEASGRIVRIENVHATALGNDRTILVLLPASYASKPAERYPVIYTHDGQNLYASVVGGGHVDWNVDGTLDRLAAAGKVREAIVVGVYSNDDRMRELDPLDRGPAYADFLIDDVKPMIDRRFRTLRGRDETYVMGSSMGGLISCYLALTHSEVFSAAACLSIHVIHPMVINPATDAGKSGAWLRQLEKGVPRHKPVRIYVDHGTVGLDAQYGPMFQRLVLVLQRDGFVEGRNLEVAVAEGAGHDEAAWAARLERPLVFLLGRR